MCDAPLHFLSALLPAYCLPATHARLGVVHFCSGILSFCLLHPRYCVGLVTCLPPHCLLHVLIGPIVVRSAFVVRSVVVVLFVRGF